jgi:hypothetical protein
MMRVAGLVAAATLVAGLAQARPREVIVPVLPEGWPALVVAGDGTAWVLAKEQAGGAKTLWRLEATGMVPQRISLPVPTAPVLLAASARDGEVWVAGYDWVAALAPGGRVRVLPLESRGARDLAVTGPGRAVLSRERRNRDDVSAEVLLLRDDAGILSFDLERFTGHHVSVGWLIPDGRGGFWAFLGAVPRAGQSLSGYLHREERGWAAWMPGAVWPDFIQPPPGLVVAGASPDTAWGGPFVARDGAGGFYSDASQRRVFYRISAGGRAQLVPADQLPCEGEMSSWNEVAALEHPGELLFLTGGLRDPWYPRVGSDPARLARFDGRRVVETQKIPLPSWGTTREWPRGAVGAGPGVQWVAYPGLLMRRDQQGWVSFSSQRMMERVFRQRREHRREVAIWIAGLVLGVIVSVGGGALLLGRFSGRSAPGVALQIAVGSGMASLPTLLALAVNPLVVPWDNYGIAAVLFMVGCLAAAGLGTAGAYSMGLWRRPAVTLAGAALGTIIGVVAALLADAGLHALLDRTALDLVSFRWALAVGLVGVFGAIGCQLSGGPKPAGTPPP